MQRLGCLILDHFEGLIGQEEFLLHHLTGTSLMVENQLIKYKEKRMRDFCNTCLSVT
jgi:hypothetical protein